MSKHDVSVTVFAAAVVEIFKLEGITFPMVYSLDGKWMASVGDLGIDGDLDVYLYCTGVSGSKVKMVITVDDKPFPPVSGKLKKGYCVLQSSIKI
jgi:hypothetical protein